MTHSASPLRRSTFLFTAWLLATTAFSFPAMAFNPNEGADAKPSATIQHLPSVEPLLGNSRYSKEDRLPRVQLTPLPGVSQVPLPPLQPVTGVSFPKIDAATIQSTFIAPPPLLSPAPSPNKPEILPSTMPVAVIDPAPAIAQGATPVAVSAAPPLSQNSKEILSRIPSKIDSPAPSKSAKLAMNRVTPDLKDLQVKSALDTYEANGIKISVRRPGLDTNFELNRAYNALAGGDSEVAIGIYKNVLSTEPKNQDALFGLAALYHRQGQLDTARSFYATLLKHYPNHREGMNNFLALVSEESPQEALAELERLEQRNPQFSTIPAQQALLLEKLGYANEARVKMLRAIELAPSNLTYKYNLAVMLDKQGNFAEAADLYRLLIQAESRGETIPAPVDHLQKRLNYIATAMVAGRPAS